MNLLDTVEGDQYDGPEMQPVAEVQRLFDEEKPRAVALDTESSTYRWHQDRADAFAVSISWGRNRTYYLPCGIDEDFEQARAVAEFCAHVFMTCDRVVMHHSKYDLHVFHRLFRHFRIPMVTRRIDDTMLLSAILDEQRHHGLKELTSSFGIEYVKGVDADSLKNQINHWMEEQERMTGRLPGYDEAPKRLIAPYAAQDAYLTMALYIRLMSELLGEDEKQKNSSRAKLMDTYLQELRLTWVLWAAEERGMAIDMDFVNRKIAELTPFLETVKVEMHQEFGFDMNPGSTEDVARALKSVGIQGEWTNPRTGKQKLPEWELERIDHPLAKRVLEYRTAQKMLTGYYEVLANEAKLEDGEWIVHPSFKQNGARTGRTSVTEPALQTIPREKGEVRGAFVSRKGHKLIFADYSGQELRVLAHYLTQIGDTSMKDVFEKGADLHRETAAAILEKAADKVEKFERQFGKNTNFAIVYGAGGAKIGWMWGRDAEFGKRALTRLYNRFPGIRKMKRMTTQAGENRGYVQTVFGRRHRMGPGTPAYRLLNYLIQGTSAELSKYAMIRVDDALIKAGLTARVLLLIHDEIVVEAPDDEVDRAKVIMEREMTHCPMLSVKMEVESAIAARWSEK